MSMRRTPLALAATLIGLLSACPPAEDTPKDDAGAKDPVSCGPATCESGQVCCNESCGICTEPGGFCTEQFCEDPKDSPCALVRCAAGTHCEVVEGECEKEPCEPAAQCVPDEVFGCELIDCKPGYTCVEDERGNGSCVPEGDGSDGVACGKNTCAEGEVCCNESCGICTKPGEGCTRQFCEDPNDDLCARVRCAGGTHCEVVQPQCFTTPCEPMAQCVPDEVFGCELIDCQPGYTCVEDERGNGSCVPEGDGVACGKNTCTGGDVCCNASCGICAPKGGACIQIACEQECTGPVIDCAAPPPGCNYEGGGCVNGQWTCGTLVCGPGCELIDCQPGHDCVEDEFGAGQCVPTEPASCAATLCPVNTYCDDISGRAECLPLPSCDDVQCGRRERCVLADVQCVRAPCPPQPVCVPRRRWR